MKNPRLLVLIQYFYDSIAVFFCFYGAKAGHLLQCLLALGIFLDQIHHLCVVKDHIGLLIFASALGQSKCL